MIEPLNSTGNPQRQVLGSVGASANGGVFLILGLFYNSLRLAEIRGLWSRFLMKAHVVRSVGGRLCAKQEGFVSRARVEIRKEDDGDVSPHRWVSNEAVGPATKPWPKLY